MPSKGPNSLHRRLKHTAKIENGQDAVLLFSTDEHLPHWEIALSFIIWVSHIIFACWCVYSASRTFETHLSEWLAPSRLPLALTLIRDRTSSLSFWQFSGFSWDLSKRQLRRDASDVEWAFFTGRLLYPTLFCMVTHYLLNTLLINWLLGKSIESNTRKIASLIIDTCLLCTMHGAKTMLIAFLHGLCIFVFGVRFFRRPEAVWLTACALLATFHFEFYGRMEGGDFFDFGGVVGYKLLQYISFCSNYLKKFQKSNECPRTEASLMDMFSYCNYLPYSTILIVTYDDYVKQTNDESRTSKMRNVSQFIKLGLRLLFWISFAEIVLHFLFVHALLLDLHVMSVVDLPTLCSIGYLAGQFFYLKYVCIFGLPSLFALMDGMNPPWPPICISRVNFYSKIWRYFDRGLHRFLLKELFLPLSQPYFSFTRKIAAAAMCFGFIWFWHGANSYLFIWAALNFVGLTLEHGAKFLARKNIRWIMLNLSPTFQQRLISCWGIVCVPWGIFGIFYFLGGYEVGNVYFNRLFLPNFARRFPFFYLVFLGYFFGNCCCVIDRYYQRHKLY